MPVMALRLQVPVRSHPAEQNRYQKYKPQLRKDFNQCCGYCDDSDETYGSNWGFHIDHFAPQKQFPALRTSYANLIYSCPICNQAKGKTWIGDDPAVSHNGAEGFIDPCLHEYDSHLYRDTHGVIRAHTPLGEYKIRTLKLNLLCHQLNWQIRALEGLMKSLSDLLEKSIPEDYEDVRSLHETLSEIVCYWTYLKGIRCAA